MQFPFLAGDPESNLRGDNEDKYLNIILKFVNYGIFLSSALFLLTASESIEDVRRTSMIVRLLQCVLHNN